MYRVLKKGGWAILQVPISLSSKKTSRDKDNLKPKERERRYGQSDHLRLYGLDYPSLLRKQGFSVSQESLPLEIVEKFALDPNEKIFFCKK